MQVDGFALHVQHTELSSEACLLPFQGPAPCIELTVTHALPLLRAEVLVRT